MKYAFIQSQLDIYAVTRLCEVLDVCRSAYYDWLDRPASQRQQDDERLVVKIKNSHQNSREAYGSRRIQDDLKDEGETVSKARVLRLMKQEGLASKHRKRFKATTNSRHDLPISANLLQRDFDVTQPDRAYVSDITYIWTSEGWLYLAVTIDLFSRLVVGWSISTRMFATLVTDALEMAIAKRNPVAGLIHHSDRGVQYASATFQKVLEEHECLGSMSRKGDCWDNAVAESFFKTLKAELIYHRHYLSRDEARLEIFEYIEVYYNRQRKHSSNGYLSPFKYEEKWLKAA
jgi:putative transposase